MSGLDPATSAELHEIAARYGFLPAAAFFVFGRTDSLEQVEATLRDLEIEVLDEEAKR